MLERNGKRDQGEEPRCTVDFFINGNDRVLKVFGKLAKGNIAICIQDTIWRCYPYRGGTKVRAKPGTGLGVDSRNKLLNKRKKEGGKRETKSEKRGGSRLLRSSSASDNKSELRPRTR